MSDENTTGIPEEEPVLGANEEELEAAGVDLDVAEAAAPDRGAPKQCTSTSTSRRSSRTRNSTWTPAPPYTSGGYSRLSTATRMALTLARCAAASVSLGL